MATIVYLLRSSKRPEMYQVAGYSEIAPKIVLLDFDLICFEIFLFSLE